MPGQPISSSVAKEKLICWQLQFVQLAGSLLLLFKA
jgi:hypothetical protein